MPKFEYAVSFTADNIEAAEAIAAKLHAVAPGRDALYYEDPLTGTMKLWAEPVRATEDLA